jgi:hypothetical protein
MLPQPSSGDLYYLAILMGGSANSGVPSEPAGSGAMGAA